MYKHEYLDFSYLGATPSPIACKDSLGTVPLLGQSCGLLESTSFLAWYLQAEDIRLTGI